MRYAQYITCCYLQTYFTDTYIQYNITESPLFHQLIIKVLPDFSILNTLVLLDGSHFCMVTEIWLILIFLKDWMTGFVFVGLNYLLK